jgi:3-keto-5-aminohexanoate cleavage enzyme
MNKVWIEAALNGPWGRERQPGIPVTVDEIVADGLAAADSGAAVIHIHAYDPTSGRQDDRWEIYARIIEGIRAKADVIVYPTIPLAGSAYASSNAQRRFAHTAELAKRGMLEWTVCDPGSCNFTRFDEIGDASAGFVYENPIADICEGLGLSRKYRLHPGYAIYEPGFTRLGAGLARALPGVPPRYIGSCSPTSLRGGSRHGRIIWILICGCLPTWRRMRHGWLQVSGSIFAP